MLVGKEHGTLAEVPETRIQVNDELKILKVQIHKLVTIHYIKSRAKGWHWNILLLYLNEEKALHAFRL